MKDKEKGQAAILFLFIIFTFPLMVLVILCRSCESHKAMELMIKQKKLQMLQYKMEKLK